jgi:hypothetical protein
MLVAMQANQCMPIKPPQCIAPCTITLHPFFRYYRFLVHHPTVVALGTLIVVAICVGVGIGLEYGPSYIAKCFEDPIKVS